MYFWIAIAAIVIAQSYYALQKQKLELEHKGSGNNKALKRQIQELYDENEALKDRLHHLEMQLLDRPKRIDLEEEWNKQPLKKPNQGFEY